MMMTKEGKKSNIIKFTEDCGASRFLASFESIEALLVPFVFFGSAAGGDCSVLARF